MAEQPQNSIELEIKKREAKIEVFQKFLESMMSNDITYDQALIQAVKIGQPEIVTCLLRAGANVNLKSEIAENKFESPLKCALDQENIFMIRLLLEHGAELNEEMLESIIKISKKFANSKDSESKNKIELEECVICSSSRDEVNVFFPCGHAQTCEPCALKITFFPESQASCPVCRDPITECVKVTDIKCESSKDENYVLNSCEECSTEFIDCVKGNADCMKCKKPYQKMKIFL